MTRETRPWPEHPSDCKICGVTQAPVSRPLALVVAETFFMEILHATVIAPAAPHIGADLGVEPVAVNVAITAYSL